MNTNNEEIVLSLICENEKIKYFSNELDIHKNDVKQSWKILKQLLVNILITLKEK